MALRPAIPPPVTLVDHVPVEAVGFDLGATAGGPRLFPATAGPVSPTANSSALTMGIEFTVTAAPHRLFGYWWWCCNSGQPTAQQMFALWLVTGTNTGSHIAGADALSGPLNQGAWNYVPLVTPVLLTANSPYKAVTGMTSNFPYTPEQFGGGEPYANGILNGVLHAYSTSGAGFPDPYGNPQGTFLAGTADPTTGFPNANSARENFWVDVQIDAP